MDPLSSRELARQIGISKGLAAQILALSGVPDPGKFRTSASYLKRLAKVAIKAGHTHDKLTELAGAKTVREGAHSRTPAHASGRARPGDRQSLPGDVPPKSDEPRQPPPESSEVTLRDLQASARTMRTVLEELGGHIKVHRGEDLSEVAGLLDKYRQLQGEFRHTVEKVEELRTDRLELMPRADVYAAVGALYQVLRAFGDRLQTDLLHLGNLPSWIISAGGSLPDTAEARTAIRRALRGFTEKSYNQLSAALVDCAVPIDGVQAIITRECRLEMAAELESAAARLRSAAAEDGSS